IQNYHRPVRITYGKGNHAIRYGKWRYISYKDGGDELYNHENDPNEWLNLSKKTEHQELIQKLKKYLPKREK
ncbi:MAG: iduronate-2-sulfatase, partial [Bacteroidetes bacterium]|nr:iduronate-2-sulfatase [Bacteroidota bacterium]